jgi:hypothetical protein
MYRMLGLGSSCDRALVIYHDGCREGKNPIYSYK